MGQLFIIHKTQTFSRSFFFFLILETENVLVKAA